MRYRKLLFAALAITYFLTGFVWHAVMSLALSASPTLSSVLGFIFAGWLITSLLTRFLALKKNYRGARVLGDTSLWLFGVLGLFGTITLVALTQTTALQLTPVGYVLFASPAVFLIFDLRLRRRIPT